MFCCRLWFTSIVLYKHSYTSTVFMKSMNILCPWMSILTGSRGEGEVGRAAESSDSTKFPHPKFIKIPIRKMCSVQLTADCQKHHALHFVQSFNHCCTCMFHSFPGLVSITLNSLFFVMGPKSTTARLWRWSTLYHWSMRTLTAKLSACFIAGAPVFIHGTSSQAASTASVASHFQAGPLGCFWQWQHTVYLMMRLNEQHGLHVWHVDHIPPNGLRIGA